MSEGAAADGGFVVFVSYSHEDAEWRRRFAEMLSPLVRERRLEVWSDDRLLVGYRWRPELAEAISRSKAALLLVSPSFLASDFIMEQELPALVEHGVRLVPVLVRQCLWQEATLLQSVQWAHDPQRHGPVAESMHPEGQIVRVCSGPTRPATCETRHVRKKLSSPDSATGTERGDRTVCWGAAGTVA